MNFNLALTMNAAIL